MIDISMDKFIDERDYAMLQKDKYTFAVLERIMGGDCEQLLTDHKSLIICLSKIPYPVWVWTSDDLSSEEMEKTYHMVSKHFDFDGTTRFNMKYDLANYFIERARADGKELSIALNMFAYDCRTLKEPEVQPRGNLWKATPEDLEVLTEFICEFHKETATDQKEAEAYREDAKSYIAEGNLYFWKDNEGNYVASCKYTPNEKTASLNLVYTRPEFRRMHYAENLVYQVTKRVMEKGYTPMLYTDAGYVASNACYEKLGYALQGKLCTVS